MKLNSYENLTMIPTQICLTRLKKEYELLSKNPIPNVKIYVSEKNLLEWHLCFYNIDDTQYKGGEYFGLIICQHPMDVLPLISQFAQQIPNIIQKIGLRVGRWIH